MIICCEVVITDITIILIMIMSYKDTPFTITLVLLFPANFKFINFLFFMLFSSPYLHMPISLEPFY